MEIIVREATPEDAAGIAAVNAAAWEVAYRGVIDDAFLDAASLADRSRRWAERIAAAPGSVLVADQAAAVVGYCSWALPSRDEDDGPDVAELAAIYVQPASFRAGVGTALLTAGLALLAGFSEVTLWVLTENPRARAFYAHHGFIADGAVKWLSDLKAEEMRLRRRL